MRHLVLRTPRLELRPDDDAGLEELVAEAYAGIHPSDRMPFAVPWTDTDPRFLGRAIMQYHWSERAAFRPDSWRLNLLVRRHDRVIGMQELSATEFRILREVSTGSWLGMRHQGQGLGTEMRAAVLAFAFDHLGAVRARSGAFADNPASLRVSEKLGYRRDGTRTLVRRGKPADEVRLVLDAGDFVRPPWRLEVEGLDPEIFGAG